jgi:hypothetical protein
MEDLGEFLSGEAAVFFQLSEDAPIARMEERPGSEGGGAEAALGGGEAVEVRELVVGAIGDGFEAEEAEISCAGKACYGRGFHVNEGGLVSFGKAAFFFGGGDVVERDEALALELVCGRIGERVRGEMLTGGVVDNFADGDGFGGAKSAGQGAGVAHGDEDIDGPGGGESFAGAGDGSFAHAGAGGDGFDVADAADSEAGVMVPVTGERAELGGKCGDDGDAFHERLMLTSLVLFYREFTTEAQRMQWWTVSGWAQTCVRVRLPERRAG